ncbi:hypothetical protein LZ30DRAFT_692013 [Colletotrichum cereale]|nr:hypothetical protein LZ30DRAFT_692013 [Colletotrichum cereale]
MALPASHIPCVVRYLVSWQQAIPWKPDRHRVRTVPHGILGQQTQLIASVFLLHLAKCIPTTVTVFVVRRRNTQDSKPGTTTSCLISDFLFSFNVTRTAWKGPDPNFGADGNELPGCLTSHRPIALAGQETQRLGLRRHQDVPQQRGCDGALYELHACGFAEGDRSMRHAAWPHAAAQRPTSHTRRAWSSTLDPMPGTAAKFLKT